MAQAWYVETEGSAFGPYPLDELRALHEEGRIGPGVQLRAVDETVSYPFESLAYLFDTSAVSSAPPPRRAAPAVAAAAPRSAPGRSSPGRSSPGRSGQGRSGRGRANPGRAAAGSRGLRAAAGEEDTPRGAPRATSSLGPFGGVMAIIAVLIGIAVFALPNWVDIQSDLRIDAGTVLVAHRKVDAKGVEHSVAFPSQLDETTRRLLSAMSGGTTHVPWDGLLTETLEDPLFDEGDKKLLRQAIDQTKLLTLVIPLLLILGGIGGALAGFLANGRGAVPSGLGGVTLITGILGGICVGAFRFMALPGTFATRGGDDVSIVLGPGIIIGVLGALFLLVSGILLLKAGSEMSKKRRLGLRRRPA